MRKGDEEEAVNTGTLARTSVHDQCDAILGGVIFDVVVIGLVRSSDPPSHRSSARRHVYEVSVRCQSHPHPIVVAGLHDIRVLVATWGLPCHLPDAVLTLSSRANESAIHMPAELPSMPH